MYKLKLGKLNLIIENIQFNFNNILQYNQATIEATICKKETNDN
jgi:hypothetical protein